MQVNNVLIEESFQFTADKPDMLKRTDEIGNLVEIFEYCSAVDEKIQYDDEIWMMMVQKNVSFAEWLYGRSGAGKEDDRRRILEMVSKQSIPVKESAKKKECIFVSLGERNGAADNVQKYVGFRRDILSCIDNAEEYEEFMRSCFQNSCFADGIITEMKYIKNFAGSAKEITNCLAVLNDEALVLYEKYYNNLQEAMNILTAKLIECSPDPKHKDQLMFPFTYEEQINGENVARTKQIECSPHLKLIHKGSNLRIYFWWRDEDVGQGKKVLVGRIGRHPY